MQELRIMLQMPGLVLFDPVVLHEFVRTHRLLDANLLQRFIDEPDLGTEALRSGAVLPLYSIAPGDYRVVVLNNEPSCLPADWVLFETPTFVLQVASGYLVAADIWALLHWNAADYLPAEQLVAATSSEQHDFLPARAMHFPSGGYEVRIIGFRDPHNPNLETQAYGYELHCRQTATPMLGLTGSISFLQLDVQEPLL